jgi:hypothetical protein
MEIQLTQRIQPEYTEFIYFFDLALKDFEGNWFNQWVELLKRVNQRLEEITSAGKGVLAVNIEKLEPTDGYIFKVEIRYWDKP